MNAIPFLEKPTAQEVLQYTNIPCYEDAKRIILSELEKENVLLWVGDAGFHPSETCVIFDFAGKPKNHYDGLKASTQGTYEYVLYSDRKGSMQVNFGRIKE